MMQTEEPLNDSPVPTRRRDSRVGRRKLIRSLCRVADERRAQGRYVEAEQLYSCALGLAEEVDGHWEVAIICNNLAVLYTYTGKFDEAEPLYRRALAIKAKLLTAGHPAVATTLTNLAGVVQGAGPLPGSRDVLPACAPDSRKVFRRGPSESHFLPEQLRVSDAQDWLSPAREKKFPADSNIAGKSATSSSGNQS